MLTGTTHPVRHIADACGFTTVQHLSGLFRTTFGQPPTAYRQDRQVDGRPAAEA